MGNKIPPEAREKFSQLELTQLEEQFRYLCTKSNRKDNISQEIFLKYFLPESPQYSIRLYNSFDFDNDKNLGFNDFFLGMTICLRAGPVGKRKLIFRMFSQRGFAKVDELKKFFPDKIRKKEYAEAMYPFTSQDQREMSTAQGERVLVLNRKHELWWWCENANGARGYVPECYLKLVPSPPSGIDAFTEPNGIISELKFLKWAETSETVSKLVEMMSRFELRPPNDLEFSGPINFQHVTHMGINPVTGGFELSQLPPEFSQLFADAGITQDEAADPAMAKFITNVIAKAQYGKKEQDSAAPVSANNNNAETQQAQAQANLEAEQQEAMRRQQQQQQELAEQQQREADQAAEQLRVQNEELARAASELQQRQLEQQHAQQQEEARAFREAAEERARVEEEQRKAQLAPRPVPNPRPQPTTPQKPALAEPVVVVESAPQQSLPLPPVIAQPQPIPTPIQPETVATTTTNNSTLPAPQLPLPPVQQNVVAESAPSLAQDEQMMKVGSVKAPPRITRPANIPTNSHTNPANIQSAPQPEASDGPADFLTLIKQGKKLNPVDLTKLDIKAPVQESKQSGGGDLVSILKDAIDKRRMGIRNEDEEDGDDDDDWD